MKHDGLLIGGAGNSKCFPVQRGKVLYYRSGDPGANREVRYVLDYFRVDEQADGVQRGDYKIWRHGRLPDAREVIDLIRKSGLKPAIASD